MGGELWREFVRDEERKKKEREDFLLLIPIRLLYPVSRFIKVSGCLLPVITSNTRQKQRREPQDFFNVFFLEKCVPVSCQLCDEATTELGEKERGDKNV